MNRFFADEKIDNGFIVKDPDEVKHIKKVLRLRVKDEVEIVYDEKEYLCEIVHMDNVVEFVTIASLDIKRESDINITLFQGLPKSDKMDLIIQKTTELGIYRIVPVNTSRTIMKINKSGKLDRWEKIAYAAAKQSKKVKVPLIDAPVDLKDLKEKYFAELDVLLVPYENEGKSKLKEILDQCRGMKNIGVFIGPEGGIDEKEIKQLFSEKTRIVSLGNRILRTETAAVFSVGIVQFYLGDIGD
ncbi:MAG: 16S rRNA (uracil(1498)-N(3))-methyltransferase [Clostridiales bacterium]|nr:16S rRNA (uracil(1498)-N(3))-methyltransferase [Clostridiales bacterium]